MPINLALIGCGQIASAHIKAAHTLANTELLFAIDSDLERARQWGRSQRRSNGSLRAYAASACVPALSSIEQH